MLSPTTFALPTRILIGVVTTILAGLPVVARSGPTDGALPLEESIPETPAQIPMPDLSVLDPEVAEQVRRPYDLLVKRLEIESSTPESLARAFGNLANVYRAYRFLPQARTCYAAAARLDPSSPRWAYLLGHLERSMGRIEASDTAFHTALGLLPEDVPSRVWLGENALDEGRLEEAHALFLEATELRPTCAKAHLGLARVSLERSQPEAAIAHLESALALQAGATQIHYALGLAWSRLGEPAKARTYFDRVPANDLARVTIAFDDPFMKEVLDLRVSAQTYALRAQKAISQGRYDMAIPDLERAVELDPGRADTRYNLSASLVLLQRFHEAQGHLEQLIQSNPDYVQGYLLLARLSTLR